MSLHEAVEKMIQYKSWANEITFSTLLPIPEKELKREYKTKFKSILNTLNHVYVVDDIFKCHIKNTPHNYTSRNTEKCPDIDELWAKQQIIDRWFVDYTQSLGESSMVNAIAFEFVDGGKGEMTISEILFHIANHGTYHRGFISVMMSQIPLMMPANDLTVYLRDACKNV